MIILALLDSGIDHTFCTARSVSELEITGDIIIKIVVNTTGRKSTWHIKLVSPRIEGSKFRRSKGLTLREVIGTQYLPTGIPEGIARTNNFWDWYHLRQVEYLCDEKTLSQEVEVFDEP